MLKHAIVFRLQGAVPSAAELCERAAARAYCPCSPSQPEARGWTPPRGEKGGALVESVGGELVLHLTTEKRQVPASAVKETLSQRLDQIERETGRRPKGKQAKELKSEVVQDLLPRAFSRRARTPVWISPSRALALVGTSSLRAADSVATLLVELLGGGVILRALATQTSATVAMSTWLATKEAPAGFSIDRECELKQPDSEKSTVCYARHTLDIDEVAEHISQGKAPTKLALTWAGRVSFLLTESMTLQRLRMLDVVLQNGGEPDADAFDADVAITAGELSQLVPALIEALDGEMPADSVEASAQAAQASAAEIDPLLTKARDVVLANRRASISLVQRHLQIGYNRAARLLEDLEREGTVSPMKADGSREMLEAAAC